MRGIMRFLDSSNMAREKIFLLAGLFVAPPASIASDFTPLFVLFVEIPVLGISVLFLLVCFAAPKVGLVLSTLLFFASMLIVAWASGGYMDDAGGFLLSSLVVDIAGILIALKKRKLASEPGSSENA